MDKKTVILFRRDEDGDTTFEVVERWKFLEQLNSGYYGESPIFAKPGEHLDLDIFTGYILIDGEVIQPKPKTVVTKFELG